MTTSRLDTYTADQLNGAANILAITEAIMTFPGILGERIPESMEMRMKQIATIVMTEFRKRELPPTRIMVEVEQFITGNKSIRSFRNLIEDQLDEKILSETVTYVTNFFRNFFNEETEQSQEPEELAQRNGETHHSFLNRTLIWLLRNEGKDGQLEPVNESALKSLALLYTTLVIQNPEEYRPFRKMAIEVGLQCWINSEDVQSSDKESLELACASLRETAESSFSGNMLIKKFLAEAPQLFMYMFHLAKAEEKYAIAKNFIAALTDLPEPFASNIPRSRALLPYSEARFLPYAIDYIMHWLVSLEGFSLEDIIIEKSSPEEDKEKLREEFRKEFKSFLEDLGKIYRSLLESQPQEWSCLKPLAIQLGLIPPVVLVLPTEAETVKKTETAKSSSTLSLGPRRENRTPPRSAPPPVPEEGVIRSDTGEVALIFIGNGGLAVSSFIGSVGGPSAA